MIRTILLTVLAVVFSLHSLKAQPEVKIYDVIASPGEVLVRMDMLNFTSSNTFATFTFEISFDDDLLVFTGIQNTSISGTWLSNEFGGGTSPLVVSFTSFGSTQSLNGKLLDLRFTYYGGFSTPLNFLTEFCEVANGNLDLIPNIIYTNGSISQSAAKGDVAMTNLLSPAGAVLMPVNMGGTGFENVTQTRFRIVYDDERLNFLGIQNTILPGYSASATDGILIFEWTGTSQDLSTTTKAFDIAFNYDGSANAMLEFLPGSFVKSGSDFIATAYSNGMFESLIRNWTGAIDSDWHNPGNWAGDVPVSSDEVVISPTANNPVIDGNAETGNLQLEAGAMLTIEPGGRLSVNGSLLNNAGTANLLIRSDDTGTGSLIYESGTVPATVERYIAEEYGIWKQLSSPVTEQNIETDFGSGSFFSWFEPAQSWVSLKNNIVWPTWSDVNEDHKNFIPGKGYLAAHANTLIPQVRTISNLTVGSGNELSYIANLSITAAGDGTNVQVLDGGILDLLAGQSVLLLPGFSVQAGGEFHATTDPAGNYYTLPVFDGILNHGPVDFTLSKLAHPDDVFRAYNLLGNPYPSSIDWKAPDGWTGRNNLENDGGGYSIWIWNGSTGNYGTYNSASLGDEGTNSVGRYIAPMQGFWVKAENHLGVIAMDNNVRTHSDQEWLKQPPALADMLRLTVTGTAVSYSDEAVLEFGHDSAIGGASKMYSLFETAPALYSLKEEEAFSISFLRDISEHPEVSLGFEAGADGVYTLKVANTEFFHDIVVEDLRDNRMRKLDPKTPYHFSARTGDDPKRFVLHFKALGTDPLDMQSPLQAWAYNRMLYISNPLDDKAVAEVYSPAGLLLKTWEVNGKGLHRLPLNLSAGVYMLKLRNNATDASSKLLVF